MNCIMENVFLVGVFGLFVSNYPTWLLQLAEAMVFILPAYFGNAVPVITSGLGPIDRGKNFFDGRRLLGTNKTIGGVLGGLIAGEITWIGIYSVFPSTFAHYPLWLGFVLGFGALLGDATGSFFKRRLNIPSGGPFPIVDQLGFILMAYFLVWLARVHFPVWYLYYVIPVTLVIHVASNIFAYKMGWKDVWW